MTPTRRLAFALAILAPSLALAQQPADPPNVIALQQTVLEQISSAIDFRARGIAALRQVDDLTKQVADLTKQVADLKKAAEPQKTSEADKKD